MMTLLMKAIINCSEKIDVRMSPFAFSESNQNDQVAFIPIHVHPQYSEHLGCCLVGCVENVSLIRSSAIDTPLKAKEWLAVAHKFGVKRMVSCHIGMPKFEWESISAMYENLYTDDRVANLNFPTETFYFRPTAEIDKELDLKTYGSLTAQYNVEGWLRYCEWLSEYFRQYLKNMESAQTEAYQLQALLEDFVHEVDSSLLIKLKENLKEALDEKPQSQLTVDQLFATEKRMIKIHMEMRIFLKSMWEVLKKIEEGIPKIESNHPDLVQLKNPIRLLNALLEDHFQNNLSWSKRILLFHLLNLELGVSAGISNLSGQNELNLMFAIQMTLNLLCRHFNRDIFIDMAFHWDEACHLCNTYHSRGIGSWSLPDKPKKRRAFCVAVLRIKVWDYLKAFCLPLTTILNGGALNQTIGGEWHVREDFLYFLPCYDETFAVLSRKDRVLIEQDPHSKKAMNVTDEANLVLSRIFRVTI